MSELIVLAVIFLLLGPVGLILGCVALSRISRLQEVIDSLKRQLDRQTSADRRTADKAKPVAPPTKKAALPAQTAEDLTTVEQLISRKEIKSAPTPQRREAMSPRPHAVAEQVARKEEPVAPAKAALEERIGTRWVLIAGIITVIVAAAFFLKYAWENWSISDAAKVIAVAVCGVIALALGEITRRRSYDIVAKGVTALGFALLYTAVFAACSLYDLIGVYYAFGIAIAITAAAMAWAVVLDEVLLAFLSLLGGYLTPLILSTGRNLPTPLFSYVLVLSVGAMLCAWYRGWRTVNILAYLGTYALYALWYEKFFRGAVDLADGMSKQAWIAVGWLGVFFVIYLVMPILHGLTKKVKAHKEDVVCILGNTLVVLFYLWNTLYADQRIGLGCCAVLMCAAHFAMTAITFLRCPEDTDLRAMLLSLGLFLLTIAVPLYLKFNALAMAWAAQCVLLAFIGLRYRSVITQVFAAAAVVCACANLILRLPMHSDDFRLILNPTFGTWCFAAAAVYIGHLLYRFRAKSPNETYGVIAQIVYALAGALLLAACTMEWYLHVQHNLPGVYFGNVVKGHLVIVTGMVLLFVVRPVCPAGAIRESLSIVLIAVGSVYMLLVLSLLHNREFVIFANRDFLILLPFIAVVIVCHLIYRFTCNEPSDSRGVTSQLLYGLLAATVFGALSAEWYFNCLYNAGPSSTIAFPTSVFLQGLTLVLGFIFLIFVIRPLCPKGSIRHFFALALAAAGAFYITIAFGFLHDDSFKIFANVEFIVAISFVAALFLAAWLLKKQQDTLLDGFNLSLAFSLTAVLVLWILVTEEVWFYWSCRHLYTAPTPNWRFAAFMYISIAWALYGAAMMIAGFALRARIIRYLALALFALLLAKVFIVDMAKISPVYRIAAFFATGITLVGVSYLYQYLNKKGFFGSLLPEKGIDEAASPPSPAGDDFSG